MINKKLGANFLPLLRHLVAECVEHYNYSTEDMLEKLSVEDMHAWLLETDYIASESAKLAETFHVSEKDLERLDSCMHSPFTLCSLLIPLWPALTIRRPPLRSQVAYASIELRLVYSDGKGLTFVAQLPLLDSTQPVSEGVIISEISQQMAAMADTLCVSGLDKLHDEHASEPVTSEDEQVQETSVTDMVECLLHMEDDARERRLELLQQMSPNMYRRVAEALAEQ